MAWNDHVPSEFTIPPLEQLDPWDPRWEQAFEIKMASKAQQRRDRDEESDSMYSDDIEFANLATGTMEEQQAAMDACNDGDNDSIVSGSDVDSCFDHAPKETEPKAGIARQWKTGFVLGGGSEIYVPTTLDNGRNDYEDLNLDLNLDPDLDPDLDPGPGPGPRPNPEPASERLPTLKPGRPDSPRGGTPVPLYHNGPQARRLGGTFVPPPFPIVWERAPKDTRIEDMPGFLWFTIRDGHLLPEFDDQTWTKGFSRCLRKHIIQRAKRESR